uniref:Transcriptional adapter 1 n=1 Tax=Oryctolagus cuniculus TaxID=9986 RepID=A0A5F9D7B8_RABIT
MATFVSELEAAKKNLSEALGDNVKQYWANLKLWFKQKISKEEFDLEAHRLLTQDNVHSHNDFLLAILTRCQILVSTPEGAGSLPWTGGSAAKPGKPKGKKKLSSVRQKFDHRFQPQNPLSGAQQFVAKDPQDDDDLKLCSHTMMLPTRGQLEGRMIVTAYEHGLDNVTEEAVSAVVYAVENHLKDILTSVVSRRKAYRLRDGHFKYAFGSNVTPQPYLKNSVVAYNNLIESPPAFSAPCAGQNPASHPPPDDAEQQAALLLACSGDTLPTSLPPVNMYDLFEALQETTWAPARRGRRPSPGDRNAGCTDMTLPRLRACRRRTQSFTQRQHSLIVHPHDFPVQGLLWLGQNVPLLVRKVYGHLIKQGWDLEQQTGPSQQPAGTRRQGPPQLGPGSG